MLDDFFWAVRTVLFIIAWMVCFFAVAIIVVVTFMDSFGFLF